MAAALQAMGIPGYSFAMAVHSAMEYNSNTSHQVTTTTMYLFLV